MNEPLQIAWCIDAKLAQPLAEFFVRNVSTAYISHSEIMEGRAEDFHSWSKNLFAVLTEEFTNATGTPLRADGSRLLIAYTGSLLAALGLVKFSTSRHPPFVVIEDLVVDANLRRQKVASCLVEWVEKEAEKAGAFFLFAESGISNQSVHVLAEKLGFHQSSIVLAKRIRPVLPVTTTP